MTEWSLRGATLFFHESYYAQTTQAPHFTSFSWPLSTVMHSNFRVPATAMGSKSWCTTFWPWSPSWLSGWWFQPLWQILANWDDYPSYGKINMFQTTNQLFTFGTLTHTQKPNFGTPWLFRSAWRLQLDPMHLKPRTNRITNDKMLRCATQQFLLHAALLLLFYFEPPIGRGSMNMFPGSSQQWRTSSLWNQTGLVARPFATQRWMPQWKQTHSTELIIRRFSGFRV